MAWRYTKVEDQREYLVKSYISKTATMSELCEECGISRKTGYKWVERYRDGGVEALRDQSRAPASPYCKFSEERVTRALELKRQYPSYGPKKIHAMLTRMHPREDWPSPSRLHQVFSEHHLVSSRKLRRRVARTHPLGQLNASNDVWCADFKGWFLTGDKSKVEPLTITDGFSRFAIRCVHLERKTFEEVWKMYCGAFDEFGLPLRIRTDNGPPFATTGPGRLSRLAVNLIKAGIIPEWINPGHPEENGRHERFHRSLKEETACPAALTFEEQVQRMATFVEEYNFDRPHEALNMAVPGSVYAPSPRQWQGVLRSPEYDRATHEVRRVGTGGCFHWKGTECYVGQLLAGEYIGLQRVDEKRLHAFYGPVFLGTAVEKEGFERPLLPRR